MSFMKLLLHICCGPCSTPVILELAGQFDVVGFYYNPNIFPEAEYEKRRKSAQKVADKNKAELVVPEQTRDDFFEYIADITAKPERCYKCYRQRFESTAKYAKNNNFDIFSTTLLISPYQDHERLREIAQDVAEKYGLKFFYQDFRPLFPKSREMAREMDLYQQKYCGCKYSRKRK